MEAIILTVVFSIALMMFLPYIVFVFFPIVVALAAPVVALGSVGLIGWKASMKLFGRNEMATDRLLARKLRGLIVDDELFFAKGLEKFLFNKNITVDIVENGASSIVPILSGNYDFVVMDQLMPGLSGSETVQLIDACAEIVDSTIHSPEVIFCSSDDAGSWQKIPCKHLAVTGFLKKRDFRLLTEDIMHILSERQLQAQLN